MDVGLDEIFVYGLLPLHLVSTDCDWKSRMEVSVFFFNFLSGFFYDNPLGLHSYALLRENRRPYG